MMGVTHGQVTMHVVGVFVGVNVVQSFISYMRGLAGIFQHVENTYMITSFH